MSTTAFHNLTVNIGGSSVPVTEVSFRTERDMELVYANDAQPVGKAKGVRRFSGQMKMLAKDALRLEAAAPEGYIDNLDFDMVVVINTPGIGFVTKTFKNCSITSFDFSAAKEDANIEVTMPIVFTGIKTK